MNKRLLEEELNRIHLKLLKLIGPKFSYIDPNAGLESYIKEESNDNK